MPRPLPEYPTKPHKTGQARIKYRGKTLYFGKHGTKESRAAFDEWREKVRKARGRTVAPKGSLSVVRLIDKYLAWAAMHYGRTIEFTHLGLIGEQVTKTHGRMLADDFGPVALKEVRDDLVKRGLSRSYVNSQIGRLKRIFQWAVENELVGPSVAHALASVKGLRAGRTTAPESRKVEPADEHVVAAVMPYLSSVLQGMIRLQQAVGMRSSELCQMRGCDLDTSQDIWLYRVPKHKSTYRGRELVYHLGPNAQDIIREFLRGDPNEYLFRPVDSVAEKRAIAATARKTKRPPSQLTRKKAKPLKAPGSRYNARSYRRAILYGLAKLNRKRKKDDPNATDLYFHPHQLRHSKAVAIRRAYGLEGSKVSLGHAHISATQHYTELDAALARQIAKESG